MHFQSISGCKSYLHLRISIVFLENFNKVTDINKCRYNAFESLYLNNPQLSRLYHC